MSPRRPPAARDLKLSNDMRIKKQAMVEVEARTVAASSQYIIDHHRRLGGTTNTTNFKTDSITTTHGHAGRNGLEDAAGGRERCLETGGFGRSRELEGQVG